MKRILLALLLAVSFVSCNNEELIIEEALTWDQQIEKAEQLIANGNPQVIEEGSAEYDLFKIISENAHLKAPGVNCFGDNWYVATDGKTGNVHYYHIFILTGEVTHTNYGNTITAAAICFVYDK